MKKKIVLLSALLVAPVSTGAVVANFALLSDNLKLNADSDLINGSVRFDRSSGIFQDLGNNITSVSGKTDRESTYYAISHNSSDITSTSLVASLSDSENYVSFSNTASVNSDFAFQALTGIKVFSTNSEAMNIKAYYSSDGVNFSNYETVQASTSGNKFDFSNTYKYLRLGGVSSELNITAIELLFSCSPSGEIEPEKTMFEEINDKINYVTKSFGNFIEPSSEQTRVAKRNNISRLVNYNTDVTIVDDELYYGGYNTHVPYNTDEPYYDGEIPSMAFDYDTNHWLVNGQDTGISPFDYINYGHYYEPPFKQYLSCSVEDLFNHQQQLKYILIIYNFIHEALSKESYGFSLEYGKTYEGEAFMETIGSLNTPIRAYGWPSPKLKVRIEKEDNTLTFVSSWDYRSPQMEVYVPYWNMTILSTSKFYFDDNNNLLKAASNYNFYGPYSFNSATAMFDFVDDMYYAIYMGNSGNDRSCYPDSPFSATKEKIIEDFNAGKLTSDYNFICSSKHVQKAKMGLDCTTNDISAARTWVSRLDCDESEYEDWSFDDHHNENIFCELWDEIYPIVSELKFVTSFEDDNNINVGNMFDQASKYTFWKSVFVYDDVAKYTNIPFIEYDSLVKYLVQLSSATSGEVKSSLDDILSFVVTNKDKYIGSYFEINSKTYRVTISSDDTRSIFSDNLLSYTCSNGFSYVISDENGNNLVKFRIVDGNAQLQ